MSEALSQVRRRFILGQRKALTPVVRTKAQGKLGDLGAAQTGLLEDVNLTEDVARWTVQHDLALVHDQ